MEDNFDPGSEAIKQIMQAMSDRIGNKLKRITITIDGDEPEAVDNPEEEAAEGEEMPPEAEGEAEADPFMERLKRSAGK